MSTIARLLACLIATFLLTGCEWLQQQTDNWPGQQNEAQPDPAQQAHDRKIAELVAKGNLAFTKDRLTMPTNDNALLYFHQALALDPGNEEAQAGLRHVAKRFRKLARVAHGNGDRKLAMKYLQQSEAIVGVDHHANIKLRHELEETPEGQDPRSLEKPLKDQYKAQQKQLKDKKPAAANTTD